MDNLFFGPLNWSCGIFGEFMMIVDVVLKVDFAGDIAKRWFVGSGEPGFGEYVAAIFDKSG
jgi:hypothetical protein